MGALAILLTLFAAFGMGGSGLEEDGSDLVSTDDSDDQNADNDPVEPDSEAPSLTDFLNGDAGNDTIDSTEVDAPSVSFDLVKGELGDDTMRGDDGDFLYGVYETEDGQVLVDTEGTDVFEVMISDDPNAAPVIIAGLPFGQGTDLGETLFLYAPDGTQITQEELDANLVSEAVFDGAAYKLSYAGQDVAYVFDSDWLFTNFGVECAQEAVAAAEMAKELGLSDGLDVIDVAVTEAEGTGDLVPEALFGANVVYGANTDEGDPLENFKTAIEALDVDHVRFPAGEGDGKDLADDGINWLNVVKMEMNEAGELDLRPELKVLLDWAQDPDGDGDFSDSKQVTLVLPTKAYSDSEYAAFAPEIAQFTQKLMEDYGDVIAALEIGNEYWVMGETSYATKANIAIDSILEGFEAANVAEEDQPDILVQMATPNSGSEFHASVDDRGWVTRVEAANQQIIDNLSVQSKDAIDGVIEHYYFNENDDVFARDNADVNYINVDYEVWDEAFDKDLSLYITEWNVKTNNIDQNGLKYTGTFHEQLSNLVEMGVDVAHVWAVQHNTTTDLAGGKHDDPVLDDEGRVVSTIRGATFDLAQEALPGAEMLDLTYGDTDGAIEIYGYAHEDRVVFYVSSRIDTETSVELDFSLVVPEFVAIETAKITMDTSEDSSDGMHHVPNVGQSEADYAIVDGERFYYGEHDAQALILDGTATSNVLEGDLLPYETYQITFFLNEENLV